MDQGKNKAKNKPTPQDKEPSWTRLKYVARLGDAYSTEESNDKLVKFSKGRKGVPIYVLKISATSNKEQRY